ncbi:MAG: penicillin-binding transpeptidase domain-containing protein, partial [Pseudoflavonifractor sp.]
MAGEKKKQQPDHRANSKILYRTLWLMAICGVLIFVPLVHALYQIQIVEHEKYNQLAVEQQTRDRAVAANRGTISDCKGVPLAMSATAYDIILSPLDVDAVQEKYKKQVADAANGKGKKPDWPEPTDEVIAEKLAGILGQEQDKILLKLAKTKSQYERLATKVEDNIEQQVRALITDYHLANGIVCSPTSKRYYPKSTLAAQVVGFVDGENQGAYGMEARYNSALAGETGRVVTAKNGHGTEMLSRYENYYDATDGDNVNLTIDSTIQYYCERVLQKGIDMYEVQNGGFAIAMDPKTGAILAWANSPGYDLNSPGVISDPKTLEALEAVKLASGAESDAYKEAVNTARQKQWSTKGLEAYEPGSTFKAMVLAAALEEGVVNENTQFNCTGSVMVPGYPKPISCSKKAPGHGSQNLAQAVANSCNPAFIAIGQKLGAEKFYDYIEDFGFTAKTGIDLQGELMNTVWDRDYFTSLEGRASVATASFGQRLTATPIQMITAAAAVVNGGHLMRPYVLGSITDGDGNVVESNQPTEVRQVVSRQTSERCRNILEGVVNGGTGKNAYQPGYRIGGKTGSSETLEEDHTIVSFLGFAPADDPKVIILLAYDNPKPAAPNSNYTAGGVYISGGNMGAPRAGELLANILDYMGVEKQYTEAELSGADMPVPNVTGLPLAEAQKLA